jgi:hypothetical protein
VSRYPRASAKPVAPFNELLRYPVPDASIYLGQSPAQTWIDIRLERLRVICEGKRTFVPGAEIARRCRLAPAAESPQVA